MSRATNQQRDECAEILKIVAEDGLPEPEDPDVALDAIIEHLLPDRSRLYYEAHITLIPLTSEQQKTLQYILMYSGSPWRQATFVMNTDGRTPSAFISRRCESYQTIRDDTRVMVACLTRNGLTVTRTKIEDTLLDTSRGDVI